MSHPLSLFPSKKKSSLAISPAHYQSLDFSLDLLHVTGPLKHSTYTHTRAFSNEQRRYSRRRPLIYTNTFRVYMGPKQTSARALKLDRLSCFMCAAVIDTLYKEDGEDERRGNRRRLTCARLTVNAHLFCGCFRLSSFLGRGAWCVFFLQGCDVQWLLNGNVICVCPRLILLRDLYYI